jgi:hypothetical protein
MLRRSASLIPALDRPALPVLPASPRRCAMRSGSAVVGMGAANPLPS